MHAASPPNELIIERCRVVGAIHATPGFDEVLRAIALGEGGEVWVRELGFGPNRSFSPQRMVRDVGAFERVVGVHLSLGAKHGVYKKPGLRHKDAHYHVDVFPITERVFIDDAVVFAGGLPRVRVAVARAHQDVEPTVAGDVADPRRSGDRVVPCQGDPAGSATDLGGVAGTCACLASAGAADSVGRHAQ